MKITKLTPIIRRLTAGNSNMFTGPGTNSYLLGENEVTIIDPGPPMVNHIEDLISLTGKSLKQILITHTHPDHSPAAHPLAAATGAELLGKHPPAGNQQDQTFSPDRVLDDGERLESEEFSVRAIYTPGHASNHLCYLHEQLRWVFTGDHVMNGSTVVINPPDGHMGDYLESLNRVKALAPSRLAPGHGALLQDPSATLDWIIGHRLEREAKVVTVLTSSGGEPLNELVKKVYDDVDTRLHGLAERSLLAHLIKLREDSRAREEDRAWYLITEP